MTCSG